MQCTTGLYVKPIGEEVVLDKQWLNNKKAWMISSVEIMSEELKIKYNSEDIRMLIWEYTTKKFSNIKLRRIISLLGKTSLEEKRCKEKLEELIVYREDKKLKKKELSKKISEEQRKKLEEMFNQSEKTRAKEKCRILNNPDMIEFLKKGRKISLRLEHLIYYLVSILEEPIEELKDSLLWEELKVAERCREAEIKECPHWSLD